MTKHEEMQAFVRHYKRINNKTVVTMAEIALAAIAQGWPAPPPLSGEERLAKQFAAAEREEIRYDKKTKRPYRANLAMTERLKDGKQLPLWIDVDEATRNRGARRRWCFRVMSAQLGYSHSATDWAAASQSVCEEHHRKSRAFACRRSADAQR